MSETIKQTGYPSKLRLHEKDATFFQKYPVIPGCSIFSLIKYTSRKYRKEIAEQIVLGAEDMKGVDFTPISEGQLPSSLKENGGRAR